jgi:hypothetical protein
MASGAARAIYGVGRGRKLAVTAIAKAVVKIITAARDSGMIGLNDIGRKPIVPEIAISIHAPQSCSRDAISRTKHLATVLRADSIPPPFEVNIWSPDKKVLNAEYNGSFVDIVSFRRGPWEDVVLSAAERAPFPLAVKSRIPLIKSPMSEYSDQSCIVITEEFWARLRNTVWFNTQF